MPSWGNGRIFNGSALGFVVAALGLLLQMTLMWALKDVYDHPRQADSEACANKKVRGSGVIFLARFLHPDLTWFMVNTLRDLPLSDNKQIWGDEA